MVENEIERLKKLCGKEWVNNFIKTFDHMGEMLAEAIIEKEHLRNNE